MTKLRKTPAGVYHCGKCGWKVDDQATPWRSTCPVCPTRSRPAWLMVGDLVERGLRSIGITKPLVERITRTAGKPGGCGCQQRQQWLNEAGVAVQRKAAAWTEQARRFYLGS